MTLPQNNPSGTAAWEKLRAHFSDIQHVEMKELFANDNQRVEKMSINWDNFYVDFSKNRIIYNKKLHTHYKKVCNEILINTAAGAVINHCSAILSK